MHDQPIELERLRLRRDAQLAAEQSAPAARSRGQALCLSGGGYRAALFHLGTLLRLHETGWLQRVDQVSSVSGGSIVSAWLAARYLALRRSEEEGFADWCARVDFRAEVVEPFRAIVARDLRSLPILLTLPWNCAWPSMRVAMVQRAFARFLGDLRVQDLPESPGFVFCATNLTFGVNWEFSRRRIGDYLTGYLNSGRDIPLAYAVAASASFPPVFGPVRFSARAEEFSGGKYDMADADALCERIELSDGGLYDNLGTEPALRNYREVFISDAGAPFPFVAGQNVFKRLLRYTEVIGNQAGALRKRLYFLLRHFQQFDGCYWSLHGRIDAGADGYSPALVADVIGRIRTDLDRFSAAEFSVLVNHGYFACEDGLQASERGGAATPARWPYPDYGDEARVRRELRASHWRFWPARWWRR